MACLSSRSFWRGHGCIQSPEQLFSAQLRTLAQRLATDGHEMDVLASSMAWGEVEIRNRDLADGDEVTLNESRRCDG